MPQWSSSIKYSRKFETAPYDAGLDDFSCPEAMEYPSWDGLWDIGVGEGQEESRIWDGSFEGINLLAEGFDTDRGGDHGVDASQSWELGRDSMVLEISHKCSSITYRSTIYLHDTIVGFDRQKYESFNKSWNREHRRPNKFSFGYTFWLAVALRVYQLW
jgi:hypothetical protein